MNVIFVWFVDIVQHIVRIKIKWYYKIKTRKVDAVHISFCLFYSIMLSNECIAFTQCIFSFAFSMVSCYQMNASLEQSCTYILFASILLISCIVYVVYARIVSYMLVSYRIVSHRIASSRIKPSRVESNWIEIRSLYLNFAVENEVAMNSF